MGASELIQQPHLFKPNQADVPNLEPENSPIWLLLSWPDEAQLQQELILKLENPLFRDVRFYLVSKGKVVDSALSGTQVPLINRRLYNHMPMYQIPRHLKSDHSQLLIRIESEMRLQIPMTLSTVRNLPINI